MEGEKHRFLVEVQREAKRWINSDLKIDIYQTDGVEIFRQTQKIKLKYPRTRIQSSIALSYKVRKGVDRKKKDIVGSHILESLGAVQKSAAEGQGPQCKDYDLKDKGDRDQIDAIGRGKLSIENYGLITSRLVAQRSGLTTWQIAEQLH